METDEIEKLHEIEKLNLIHTRIQELKKIYVLVEVKKYNKAPEWIEKLKEAIVKFDKMTWVKNRVPYVEPHERQLQFLQFLKDILLCQALFFLPSCPCEHLTQISQHINVICMHGRDLQLRIYLLQVDVYLESAIEHLKTQGSNPPAGQQPVPAAGVTQGLFNSNCIKNEIGNLLNRL